MKLYSLKNKKAMASIETAMLLVVFTVILGYAMGSFGIIHTSIVNSIAARTYAFDTFDNRAELTYFRSVPRLGILGTEHYANIGFRIHGIAHEEVTNQADPVWTATERNISIFTTSSAEEVGRNSGTHNESLDTFASEQTREQISVNPVWIKTTYGICMNAACGEGAQ